MGCVASRHAGIVRFSGAVSVRYIHVRQTPPRLLASASRVTREPEFMHEPIGWSAGRPGGNPFYDLQGLALVATVLAVPPGLTLLLAGVPYETASSVALGVGAAGAFAFALHLRRRQREERPVRIESGAVYAINADGSVHWVEPLRAYSAVEVTTRHRLGVRRDYLFSLAHHDSLRAVYLREVVADDPVAAVERARALAAAFGIARVDENVSQTMAYRAAMAERGR